MTTRVAALVGVLLSSVALAVLPGCASSRSGGDFTRQIDKVRPGMTPDQVRAALGNPDRTSRGVVEMNPMTGSSVALYGVVPVGSRYEDWFYSRHDTHYHVLFGPDGPRGSLVVVTTPRATPASAAVGEVDPVPPAR